jgi:hypothetical protein
VRAGRQSWRRVGSPTRPTPNAHTQPSTCDAAAPGYEGDGVRSRAAQRPRPAGRHLRHGRRRRESSGTYESSHQRRAPKTRTLPIHAPCSARPRRAVDPGRRPSARPGSSASGASARRTSEPTARRRGPHPTPTPTPPTATRRRPATKATAFVAGLHSDRDQPGATCATAGAAARRPAPTKARSNGTHGRPEHRPTARPAAPGLDVPSTPGGDRLRGQARARRAPARGALPSRRRADAAHTQCPHPTPTSRCQALRRQHFDGSEVPGISTRHLDAPFRRKQTPRTTRHIGLRRRQDPHRQPPPIPIRRPTPAE